MAAVGVGGRRRRATRGALAAVLAVALAAVGTPAADATAGTWAGLGYRAGRVCSGAGSTSPLVSWDLGGGYGVGYLTSPITESGGITSALPPLDSVGVQSSSTLSAQAGSAGGLSPGDVGVLAALLSQSGGTGDDATAAAVADIVMTRASGGGAGCADSALEQRLSARAQQLAGPYTVSFPGGGSSTIRTGSSTAVTVQVVGASGAGVPGVSVAVSADQPVFGSATSTTATTDGTGQARLTLSPPADSTATTVSLTATVSVATTLTLVTAQAYPRLQNPSGNVVSAVVAGEPVQASATSSFLLDTQPHPKLTVSADPAGTLAGSSVTPTVAVTGLNGHQADVAISVRGPLPLTDKALCSGRGAADFASAATSDYDTTADDDGTVTGTPFTAQAGCYWISARLTTTDATQQATASGALATPVVVLDTAVDAKLDNALVPVNGSAGLTVRTQHTHGADLTVRATLSGPVRPTATGCTGADYSKAKTTDVGVLAGAAAASGSGADAVASQQLTVRAGAAGCSRVGLVLAVGGSTGLRIAVPVNGAADLLALAPSVTAVPVRTWGQTQQAVAVQVSSAALYGQSAHVQVRLQRTDSSLLGCRSANFAAAALGAAGPSAALTGGTATVQSVTTTRTGCYRAVASLVVDANPAIKATSTPGSGDAVGVGVAVDTVAAGDAGGQQTGGTGWLTVRGLLIFLVLLVPALAVAGRYALAARAETIGAGGGLGVRPRPGPGA